MNLITTALFSLLSFLLYVAFYPLAVILLWRWRKHEREALNRAGECKPVPHCSLGYDYEIPQTTEIDWDAVLEEIKSDMGDNA